MNIVTAGKSRNGSGIKIIGFVFILLAAGPVCGWSQDVSLAETEIPDLQKSLERSFSEAAASGSGEAILSAFSSADSRLALFELTFGLKPVETKAWPAFLGSARQWLVKLESLSKKGEYFDIDSSRSAYCIVLSWTGQGDKAFKLLEKQEAGGGCGNWVATVNLSKYRLESHIYQLKGNYAKALQAYEKALENIEYALDIPEPDLLYAEFAFLLGKNNRTEKSIGQYQQVADLFPGTSGGKLSVAALRQLHAYQEPTASRLVEKYLKSKNFLWRELAIAALAKNRFPESYTILAKIMADNSDDGFYKSRCVIALGELGDKRAVPLLKKRYMTADEDYKKIHALSSLVRLGDTSDVLPFLQDLKKRPSADSQLIHTYLFHAYGGGPEIKSLYQMEPATLAEKWIEWLGKNKVVRS